MKRIIYLPIIFGIAIFSSCEEVPPIEPDVNNITINNDVKDSLNIAQQLAALNEAGEFYNVNMKILDGTTPIEGAEVKLTSSLNGDLIELIEVSDASGNVIFDEVTVGGNIIEVQKEGYYSALGLMDFKFERGYNYEVIDDVVAPITKNESAIIPLYNAGSGTNTAKIKGKVSIETDLTNRTQELVTNQLIKADFSGNIVNVSEGISFSEYSLNVEGGLGESVTNSDGEYEILLPTGNEGITVNLLIPQLRLKQKLAYYDAESEEPTLDSVMTTFGYNEEVTDIPFVRGIKTIVPEPAAEGRGVQIVNFSKAGRAFNDIYDYPYNQTIYASEEKQEEGEMLFLFTAGSGYKAVPDVTIEDPTGEGAKLKAIANYAVQSVTLDSSAQYAPDNYVYYNIRAYYNTQYGVESYSLYSDGLNTNSNGRITQEQLDQSLAYAFENRNWFGDNYSSLYNNYNIDSITIDFDQYFSNAVSKGTVTYNAKVTALKLIDFGQNYTNPTISFVGGDPEVAATFEIFEFRTRWNFEFDNSNNSTPYVAIPAISFEYLKDDVYKLDNVLVSESGDFNTISDLMESTNGEIGFGENENYSTRFYSMEAPVAYVKEPVHSRANLVFEIYDGSIAYAYNRSNGNGYSEKFTMEVVPQFPELSGSGAEIQIIGGSQKGDEYQWRGDFIVHSAGEGYVDNVNQAAGRGFTFSYNNNNISVKPQDEIIIDIDYGTGRR